MQAGGDLLNIMVWVQPPPEQREISERIILKPVSYLFCHDLSVALRQCTKPQTPLSWSRKWFVTLRFNGCLSHMRTEQRKSFGCGLLNYKNWKRSEGVSSNQFCCWYCLFLCFSRFCCRLRDKQVFLNLRTESSAQTFVLVSRSLTSSGPFVLWL